MYEKIHPYLMSAVLAVILFVCTLLVEPLIILFTLITWSQGNSDQIVSAIIIIFILGTTAGLTAYSKKDFGFGFYHCIILFVILSVMCCLNPLNSTEVFDLTYRWMPLELVEILDGKIASSLFFSIPITLVSVLTLAIPMLIKRVKEQDH